MKLSTCRVPVGWLICAALSGALQGCSGTSRWFGSHAAADTARDTQAPPVLMPAGSAVPAADGAVNPAAVPAVAAEPERSAAAPVAPAAGQVNEKPAALAARDPAPERPATASVPGEDLALLPSNAELPKGRWAARIGLFGVEANAYRQAATLRDALAGQRDLSAEQRIVRVVRSGERYLVLLGDLADVQAARQLVGKVRQILHQDAIVYTR